MKTTLRWLDQHFEEMLMAFFLCGEADDPLQKRYL